MRQVQFELDTAMGRATLIPAPPSLSSTPGGVGANGSSGLGVRDGATEETQQRSYLESYFQKYNMTAIPEGPVGKGVPGEELDPNDPMSLTLSPEAILCGGQVVLDEEQLLAQLRRLRAGEEKLRLEGRGGGYTPTGLEALLLRVMRAAEDYIAS